MKKEDLEIFIGKKINIVANFSPDDKPFFYTGRIKRLNDDTVLFVDKFNKLVTINISDIRKVAEEVVKDERKE